MRARTGMVLVAVLLTGTALIVIATLAALMGFMQLEGARYAQRRQAAEAAAHSGVVLVEVVLAAHVRTTGALPPDPPPLPEVEGLAFRLLTYRPSGPRDVEVEVEARRAGAVARAGARLRVP